MSIKAYKYRIYTNTTTTNKLQWVLDRCRELYNAGLQERRDAYELVVKRHPGYYDEETRKQLTREHTIGYYEQQRELVDVKELRPEYQEIASHVLQNVILRLKRAYDRFFRRVQNGEQPGYPRFQGKNRYNSFCYPDGAGWKLEAQERPAVKKGIVRVNLKLTKIGTVKLHLHRNIEGTIKTLTIKREGEHWYAIFTCEIDQPEPLPTSHEDVGIDLGVTHFAALSNGEFIDHPHYLRKAEKKLVKAHQALSRKRRGSHRRKKAVQQVVKCHRQIANQRKDFQHKASRKLVNRYQVIVFEDLQVKNLTKAPAPKQDENGKYVPNGAAAKAGLNKSILDAGWSMFTAMVSVKAAWAGRTVIFVDPSKTSQICPNCGNIRKKTIDERWHSCECGCELDRDTASAKVILDLGRKHLLVGTRPTSATA
ncbi:MAG TPA: transposase [Ktedonobacteraceae bacterium]|jgi:putative transposase|nr:transposase [Ktedonobacteraceae bacterium]